MFVAEALAAMPTQPHGAPVTPAAPGSTQLCPAISRRSSGRSRSWRRVFTPDEFLEQLEAEHRIKPEVRESRGIGFVQ